MTRHARPNWPRTNGTCWLARIAAVVLPVALFLGIRTQLSWRPRLLGRHPFGVMTLAFSPDGKVVAAQGGDHDEISAWDATAGTPVPTPSSARSWRRFSMAFAPGGETLSSPLYYATGPPPLLNDQAFSQFLTAVRIGGAADLVSFDRTLIAMCAVGCESGLPPGPALGAIQLRDAHSHKLLRTLPNRDSLVSAMAFSPDSRTLAAGYDDGRVLLWRIR